MSRWPRKPCPGKNGIPLRGCEQSMTGIHRAVRSLLRCLIQNEYLQMFSHRIVGEIARGGSSKTSSGRGQVEMPPGHVARVVSRPTISTNVGPHGVNRARRRYSDIAHKRRTAIADAAHLR